MNETKWAFTKPRPTGWANKNKRKEYRVEFWELNEKGEIKYHGNIVKITFYAMRPTAAARQIAKEFVPESFYDKEMN